MYTTSYKYIGNGWYIDEGEVTHNLFLYHQTNLNDLGYVAKWTRYQSRFFITERIEKLSGHEKALNVFKLYALNRVIKGQIE